MVRYGTCLTVVNTLYGSLRRGGYPIVSFNVKSVLPFFDPVKPFTHLVDILNIILEYNNLKFIFLANDILAMVGIIYLKKSCLYITLDTPIGFRNITLAQCTAAFSDNGYKWKVCGNLCGSPIKGCDLGYNLNFGACSIVMNGRDTKLYKLCIRPCTTCYQCAQKIKNLNKTKQKVYVQCSICKVWNPLLDKDLMCWESDPVSTELSRVVKCGWYERPLRIGQRKHLKNKNMWIWKKA